MKLHPDGVAALVAAIVAPEDIKGLAIPDALRVTALRKALERRQGQVLRMARQYYKVYEPDFDESRQGWRDGYERNGLQNLARLDRPNLR